MKFEIKCRFTGSLRFECEADSLRVALEMAVEKKVSLYGADLKGADLKGADLKGADLTGANLTGADLYGADLTGADLKGADLKGADLKGADLKGADLTGANLTGADLTGADLEGADLTGADLYGADLTGADLKGANLEDTKSDFISIIEKLPTEIPGLYRALLDGKVDGSTYRGECACLVGTIANAKGCDPEMLKDFGVGMDSTRPAEKWFLAIRKGDTPANNQVSAITQGWIEEFCKEKSIALPTRQVIWN